MADACHAIGGSYQGRPVGSLAALNAFSFHPVKHVTTGEGGAVATDDADPGPAACGCSATTASRTDFRQRETAGSWAYEMVELGYNYRLTDIQCALGVSQLAKLPALDRPAAGDCRPVRRGLRRAAGVRPLAVRPRRARTPITCTSSSSNWRGSSADRGQVFRALGPKGSA